MKRSKKKQLQKIEEQDSLGISRRVAGKSISLKLFVIIKVVCIVMIPLAYFLYSPLLSLCLLLYVGLFFLAVLAERRMNVSVIKRNHVKIFKMDSAVALLVVVVAIFGAAMGGTNKIKRGGFADMPKFNSTRELDFDAIKREAKWRNFLSSMKNFGAVLTGERALFQEEQKMEFGAVRPPEDFPIDRGDFQPPEGMEMPDFKPPEVSVADLPVEYMFSSVLSSVNTVLVFSVSVMGALSLIAVYLKKRKIEMAYSQPILDGKINFTDEDIDRILSFGVKPQETGKPKETERPEDKE